MDHQRSGPARSERLDPGQLLTRQIAAKEPGDVGSRETELARTDDDRPAVEDVRGQVESRIEPERHGNVEIGRRAFQ